MYLALRTCVSFIDGEQATRQNRSVANEQQWWKQQENLWMSKIFHRWSASEKRKIDELQVKSENR